MVNLNEYEVPLFERLLISLHNLCATDGEIARKSEDLAQILQADINVVNWNLGKHVSDGSIVTYCNHEGNRRFYLTSKGITRVCSLFS